MSYTQEGHLVFDNHEIQTFRSCPQMYEWMFIKRKQRVGAKRTAAEFGSAIHLALEERAKGKSKDECVVAAITYYTPFADPADDKRTLGKLIQLIELYWDYYAVESYDIDPANVEVGGVVPLTQNILYSFRMDKVVTWRSDKLIYGIDHKTTSSTNSFIVRPNNQFTGYIYALREMFENVGGLVVDLIGVYKTKPAQDKHGDWKPGCSPSDIFARYPTHRTKSELDEWKDETLQWITLIEKCIDSKNFPKNTTNCTAYNARCPFMDVCNMEPDQRDSLFANKDYFIDSTWSAYKEESQPE